MPAYVTLPPRLFAGRTLRVHSINCLEVELDLCFGVKIIRKIVLEGVQKQDVPYALRERAKHCLVVLVGGKQVIVHTDADKMDGYIVGRVYLNAPTYAVPEGLLTPHGMADPLLEVSTFYRSLVDVGFDVETVKQAINRPKKNGQDG